MKLTRVRFTVRRLMVAVAVVGIVLAAVLGIERRGRWLQDLTERHELEADLCKAYIFTGKLDRKPESWLANRQARLVYHMSLAKKYRQAADHPWLPVEPDLPEPK